ncbi:MAG: sugar ABC transporter permease [Actinomycetaceae bacterium]|nr:sugar ABC transporter permease [Actinomycetaceae bacterium]
MSTPTRITASSRAGRGRVDARPRRSSTSDGYWPWLFVTPLLIGVFIFYIYPIFDNFYISFTKQSAFGTSSKFVGVENYVTLFNKQELWLSVLNTLIYTGVLLLGVPIATWLAALIARPGLRFAAVYRVAFFMPYLAMPTAIALVWRLIYNGDFGVLNYILKSFGITNPPHWTSTPGWAIFAVSIVGLWSSIGFNMIILSAGLKNISPELYEAAEIDGASPRRQFFSITVPMLTPSIFFLTVIQAINGFQMFDLLFAMMGLQNPALPSSRTLVYLFYNEGFQLNHKGLAAAIAMIILLIVGILTAIQFKAQKKWVTYA